MRCDAVLTYTRAKGLQHLVLKVRVAIVRSHDLLGLLAQIIHCVHLRLRVQGFSGRRLQKLLGVWIWILTVSTV